MKRSVVIAGGGTGGHIFPGLAVAEVLTALEVEVHWIGARRGLETELVGKRGIPLTVVELEGMRERGAAAGFRALSQLPRAVASALRIMLELQPVAVLGVGGYASAAGVMAAGLLGIPWVLQEQNAAPGWTNRSLAPWADLVCCGFVDALAVLPSSAVWTGNPVRAEFFALPDLEVHEPPTILVLGGSQGSLFLNRLLPRALSMLYQDGLKPKVRHQTGARWAEVVSTAYSDLRVDAEVSAFLSEPWRAVSAADLVVARSGALTVSELAAAGRGSLLVPFAAAAGDHQMVNARSLERAGGATVLQETEATPQRLAAVLSQLLTDRQALAAMGAAARATALPDAAERIARGVLAVGGVR